MEEITQLQPIHLTHLFNMKITTGAETRACEVYNALMADGTRFTRVVMCPGDPAHEKMLDVDYRGGQWIDMYTWEPSPWTALVAPFLDFNVSFRENLLSLN